MWVCRPKCLHSARVLPLSTLQQRLGPAWDDNWGLPSGGSRSPLQNSATVAASVPLLRPITSGVNQPIPIPSLQMLSCSIPSSASVASGQQSDTTTCTLVADVEWPPQAFSMPTLQSNDAINQQAAMMMVGTPLSQGFHDTDPFVDWPPLPTSGLLGVYGVPHGNIASTAVAANNPQGVGDCKTLYNNEIFPVSSSNSRASNSNSRGNSGLVGNSSKNSIGHSRPNQGNSGLHGHAENRSADIGSIFASNKNVQAAAPRLAPPPSTAVGRGRGRGTHLQSSTSQSGTRKSLSEQPPLLHLL